MIDIFNYKTVKFPDNFLWGASTAGQQIEGNNNSFYDSEEFLPKSAFGELSYEYAGLACNSYEMFEKDIELLKKMNLKIYRMSIEWSRIEPEEGIFNEEAVKHYQRIFNLLKENNIKLCLTLHHFSHPVWFHKKGFFNTLENMKYWERYLKFIVPKIKEYVDYWIILNELNLPYVYTVEQRVNMLHYHARGYHIIKHYSDKPASSAHSYSEKYPLRGKHDKIDNLMSELYDYQENEFFFNAIRTGEICMPFMDGQYVSELKDSCDYWALNTYIRQIIDGHRKNPYADFYNATHLNNLDVPFYTEEIFPEIIINMLLRCKDKPCLITENGIATIDDRIRIVYISAILQSLKEAIDLGVNVFGYMHWSLIDNWEWGSFKPTFGLAKVDRKTFEREIKKSGHFYGEIAKNNLFSQEILQKYLNEIPSVINR
ncbi:glycoside hydrolase family 1 protein [Caloramator sp. E03]|uniref:glycoside hydrolase family 1 protein n=1 Tax=Caloramator sp. E03 TaxID=2576307 RepID=UPI001110952E|nr:family 1 glycosylhydrolase [Caloramator sp. E03]QCX34294.1 glycoside hydrolase family 1 protein [Caloramator sp. E03]